jgi:type II secretory pathway pseudopilin PulG
MPYPERNEAGFTLIEALIAIVILIFGLMAVSNLFIVSGSSNQTGSQSTATTTQATEVMERLMAIPFDQLTVGGGTTAAQLGNPGLQPPNDGPDFGAANCTEAVPADNCVTPGNYNMRRLVPGVGSIKTRWQIINPNAAGIATYFIRVRSESQAPIVGGPRSRADFTMFRTCTTSGCPGIP